VHERRFYHSVCADSIRELEITIKDLSRQQQEFSTVRSNLQIERESLQAALSESRDTIHALELKLESSNVIVNQLKIDIENITRSKIDEIENAR
jgi:chromosome segregation ATPase